jgi:drug/metabolite transporter (DMT)-like permease
MCVIGTLHFWQKEKPLWGGICALVAVLVKFQALIFVPVFALVIAEKWWHERKLSWQYVVSPLFPLIGYALIAVFYQITFGNGNAYFIAQKLVGMGMSVPFGMFNYAEKWVSMAVSDMLVIYSYYVVPNLIWDPGVN